MLKEVKKRNGQKVKFNPLNIRRAILSANEEVSPMEQATEEEIDAIVNKISNFGKDFVHIEVIQDYIEKQLMKLGHFELAKRYITYRYIRSVNRDLTETEMSILGLIRGSNQEVINENSNKNAYVNSTQRDLIAGEVSKEISKKFLLPDDIEKANRTQVFHWHDLDYTVQPMFNCFSVDTRFISNEGIKSFRDFNDGDEITVPTHTGEIKKAIVKNYGQQTLYKLVFQCISSNIKDKIVYCTRNHTWILEDGTRTTDIQVGEKTYRGSNEQWELVQLDDSSLVEDVWCLEVEDNHSFILEDGLVTGNCCLIDIENVFKYGTVMNNYLIESPKSFRVACTVMTQVIAAVASNQYGGQSVDLRHLGRYVAVSREKLEVRERFDLEEAGISFTEEQLKKIVANKLAREITDGVQTIQYQLNTLYTSNGQSPFVTLFLYLEAGNEYEDEIAMIIREVIKQRYEGIKGKDGRYMTPSFPKLVYVLDENNYKKGTKYWDLTQECAKCSIKRSYPDYISAKKMRENYEGNVFSPMGCVAGEERIAVKYDGVVHEMPFSTFYNEMAKRFVVYDQKTGKIANEGTEYTYIDLGNVKIYDNKASAFVPCYRVIRNMHNSTLKRIIISDDVHKDLEIYATPDHPFEVEGKGVVHTCNLKAGDEVLFSMRHTTNEIMCLKSLGNTIINYDSEAEFMRSSNMKVSTRKIIYVGNTSKEFNYSYDVTTETEHFEVSGIYSHNCRSFLAPWKKTKEYVEYFGEPESEIGTYKFEGRFNQGVISINLPQIAIEADHDMDKFWQLFNERMALCYKALLLRHKLLEGVISDVSPVHWQYGVIARLKQGEKIDFLLHNGYSTLSLGYIGFYEMTQAMLGVSHTTPEGKEFALRVMQAMKSQVEAWKAQTGLGFALYGTPEQKRAA